LGNYCWSPDGKRVAYIWDNYEDGDNGEVFLMVVDADGKNSRALASQKPRGVFSFHSPNWVSGKQK
jgi:hypothetical protein